MTSENEKLLIMDLCPRLLYGVQIHIDFTQLGHIVGDATLESIRLITGTTFNFVDFIQDFKNGECVPISGFGGHKSLNIDEFKPYFRSLSNITEEEKNELVKLDLGYIDNGKYEDEDGSKIFIGESFQFIPCIELYDWFNLHMFDYRGLISKGLALEAPEDMYTFNYEENR